MKAGADVVVNSRPVVTIDGRWPATAHQSSASVVREGRRDILIARGWMILAIDCVLALVGAVCGYSTRYVFRVGGLHQTIAPIPTMTLTVLALLAVSLTLVELARSGAYRRSLGVGGLSQFVAVPRAVTLAVAVIIVASAAVQEQNVSRLLYIYIWIGMVAALWIGRLGQMSLCSRAYHRGYGVQRVVVVGATPVGKMVMQNMAARRDHGYHLLGYIAEHAGMPQRFGRFASLGTIAEIDRLVAEQRSTS